MPYKHIEKKIPEKLDKRIKLTDEQRQEIRDKYEQGNSSQRKLASEYNVSRRLIQFILNPSSKEQNLLARKNRGGSKQYYDKDKNTKAIRDHRRYKQTLYVKGELEDGNSK